MSQVTYSQPFAAIIHKSQNGAKSLFVLSKLFYQNQLNKFKEGEQVTLSITNKRPKRTDQQNRYYWGVYLPLIAKESGEEVSKEYIEALHERFKGEFLSTGLYDLFGRKVWGKKSSTELSVGDFCQYILNIEKLTGIAAPPTENYGLVPLQEGMKKE